MERRGRLRMLLAAALAVALCLACVGVGGAASGATAPAVWATLSGVSCAAPGSCQAVGDLNNGPVWSRNIAFGFDGRRWSAERIATPTPSAALNGVSCWGRDGCIAIGSYFRGQREYLLAERWDGRWRLQRTPMPHSENGDRELVAISCWSPRGCMAAGDTGDDSQTLALRWSGRSWRIVPMPPPPGSPTLAGLPVWSAALAGIACSGPVSCVAVGSATSPNGRREVALIYRWNGTRWLTQRFPKPFGVNTALSGVSCPSAAICVAVGYFSSRRRTRPRRAMAVRPLVERWNGARWSRIVVRRPTGVRRMSLGSVSCAGPSACAAISSPVAGGAALSVRFGYGDRVTVGPGITVGPGFSLGALAYALSCSRPRICVAVGSVGSAALAARWNGLHWRLQRTPALPVS